MRNIHFNKIVKPKILIRCFDRDEKLVMEQEAKNSLTYAAMNIFCTALLRSGPSQVTTLYARYGSASTTAYLAPSASNIQNTTRATFISTTMGDTVRGGLWVPILSAPIQGSSNTSLYTTNQATFLFRIPYNISASQQSPANFNVSTSYIYALGLAVSPSSIDPTQDIVISVLQAVGYNSNQPTLGDFTTFQVPPGGQTSIDYVLPFAF